MSTIRRSTFVGRTPRLHRLRWSLALALLLASGSGCASSNYLSVRRAPRNPLAVQLDLRSYSGPKPTKRTEQVLRAYNLDKTLRHSPDAVLTQLQEEIIQESTAEKLHAFAELAYVQGKRAQSKGNPTRAFELFGASVAHSYLYLFAPYLDERNFYDPQFRQACDLYNSGLEELLRIVNRRNRLRPGEVFTIESGGRRLDVAVVLKGLWRADAFERFEFVSDFEVKGLVNRHVTYGLGVPLIAVQDKTACQDPAAQFYPKGMSFPVTAILRAAELPTNRPGDTSVVKCTLELHDPLITAQVQIAGRPVPLETDLTTPLGYFLDSPEFQGTKLATIGLLDPSAANRLRALYMLEAFDPQKIPVLMVHGLWSSPETWTEMLNDLRSLPEVRNRYQFWTYLYPTGQPFWISATQLRADLEHLRNTLDPERRFPALDQMVLLGHSMGGLVARLQTLDSRDDYWRLLTDRSFDELQADPETRDQLAQTVFFHPNPSIRRLVTLGTPYHGSSFANSYTRWLGRKLIRLPATLTQARSRIIVDNPDFFQNTDVLTINTSIDALDPNSPVFQVMLQSQKAPWVRYNNIIGVADRGRWLRRVLESGDGVVPFNSAHVDDVESELIVEADHLHVHQHPLAILEVRRILMEHSAEMYAEMAAQQTAAPAAFAVPVPRATEY